MMQQAMTVGPDRFQPIPREQGFRFTCRKEIVADGYIIRDLGDQDFVHNAKKLFNMLLHASRILTMGNFIIHMNQLELVRGTLPKEQHGLTAGDIRRDDRQNYRYVLL